MRIRPFAFGFTKISPRRELGQLGTYARSDGRSEPLVEPGGLPRIGPDVDDSQFFRRCQRDMHVVPGLRLCDIDGNGRRVPGQVTAVRRADDTERLVCLLICVLDVVKVERSP
jgi:hypothetical protein